MSDPGWSNKWWGRDPIEEAGEEEETREPTSVVIGTTETGRAMIQILDENAEPLAEIVIDPTDIDKFCADLKAAQREDAT